VPDVDAVGEGGRAAVGGGGGAPTFIGGGGGGGSYLNGTLVGTPIANNTGNGYVTIICSSTLLSCSLTVTQNVTCHGGSNGGISSTVSGGETPYTYLWSNAETTTSISSLSAGTYTLSVNDACGATATASATITQPLILSVSANTTANELCNGGSNGSASSTVSGGTSPYTYLWSNSQTTTSISSLTAGTYTLTVNDACGSTATASVAITQPTILNVSANTTANVFCNGGNTGSASSTVSGGTSPYTYLWSNSLTTTSISSLSAGTYTLTVTDNNGCTATASVTITQPNVLGVSANVVSNITCSGGNNGSVSSTVSGGTSPYTYDWLPSGGTNATASGLSAGTYTVSVTDNNGCTSSASVTLLNPGGVINFSYEPAVQNWTIPAGVTQVTITVAGAAGGDDFDFLSFDYLNNEGKGAVFTGICTVTPGDKLSVVVGAAGADGESGPCNQWGSGGGGGAFVYDSNTLGLLIVGGGGGGAGGASAGGNGGTNIITNATTNGGGNNAPGGTGGNGGSGGYFGAGGAGWISNGDSSTIVGYDAYGGMDRANFFAGGVGEQLAAYAYDYNPGGYGGGGGGGQVYGGGGGGGYNGGGGGGGNISVGGGGGGGSYLNGTLVGTPLDSITGNGYVTITYSSSPLTISIASQTNIFCFGGTGSAIANLPSGGVPAYTYSWSPSGGSNLTATGLTAGSYTITVTDNHGCTATAGVAITQPTILNVSANTTANVFCNGGNTGSASSSVSGGTTPYTYLWSNSLTTTSISSLSAGTYTLTVHDNNGCTGTASATITQPSALTASIGTVTDPLCNGGSGSIIVIAGGGTLPYHYAWTPSGGNLATATGLTAGCYTVTVTDANGCTATATSCITQPAALSVSANTTANVLCDGSSTGSVLSVVSGGTTPYTYLWSNGKTTTSINSLSAGTYTLTITDNNGCTGTAAATITQPNVLTVSASIISNVVCNGSSDGSASSTISGGTTPYTYLWTGGETNSSISGLSAGIYTLSVTDNNGCAGSTSVTITQPPPLVVSADSINDMGLGPCNGQASVTPSGGTAPYTYLWNPGGETTAFIFNQCEGRYCCTVTDNHGCMDSDCVTIKNITGVGVGTISSGAGQIIVYPNPSNGEFTVSIKNYELGITSSVEVYNMLGEKIYSQFLIPNSSFLIDLSNKPNGIYFYRILSDVGGVLGEGKLIIQK